MIFSEKIISCGFKIASRLTIDNVSTVGKDDDRRSSSLPTVLTP